MGNKRSISTINSMGALIERGWKIPGKFCKKNKCDLGSTACLLRKILTVYSIIFAFENTA
jgi:hypothetical protein